ncbi:MAG: hypothetical protein M1819_005916 [Sarea resinae]|nr:MAG: hypothetical protein M1819_005916 [Sarea resinae]
MATSKSSASSASSQSSQSGCFDPNDMDSFINYDQIVYPSPSPSSSRSQSDPVAVNPNNTLLPPNHSGQQQMFSGPSHQYDLHKQQTGLPVGAVATLTVNQASNLQFPRDASNFDVPSGDSFFGMNPGDEFIDFGAGSANDSFGSGADLDMDYDTPTQDGLSAFLYPERSGPSSAEYVNPSAIGGQEENPAMSQPASNANNQKTAGRLWPGMHQQQAAMAKAQAQAQAQAQHQKQQQVLQHQQQQRTASVQPRHSGRPEKSGYAANDPLVEEKISQLLNSMRQGSVASSYDDDASTPSANGVLPHIAKMRKEEEDMDEDERLLASEEGKKLTSKERRQLRNKVSARAFRSRRKEYIGQLEGEVAAKTNEANDLKIENRALMDENRRLSDLTRMLLSSSAFSTFLNDLGTKNMPSQTPSTSEQPAINQAEPPRPNTHKDANPNQFTQQQMNMQQQNDPQIGMALVPENAFNFSMLDISNNTNSWPGNAAGWANQSQVFSVLEIPAGPAVDRLDSSFLSEKTSDHFGPSFSGEASKKDMPVIEQLPSAKLVQEESVIHEPCSDVDFDESDPAFALFVDFPSARQTTFVATGEDIFGGLQPEKLFSRIDLVASLENEVEETVSAAAMGRFERTCTGLEAAFQRIERTTSYL